MVKCDIIAARFILELPGNYVLERNYVFPFTAEVSDGILTNVSTFIAVIV